MRTMCALLLLLTAVCAAPAPAAPPKEDPRSMGEKLDRIAVQLLRAHARARPAARGLVLSPEPFAVDAGLRERGVGAAVSEMLASRFKNAEKVKLGTGPGALALRGEVTRTESGFTVRARLVDPRGGAVLGEAGEDFPKRTFDGSRADLRAREFLLPERSSVTSHFTLDDGAVEGPGPTVGPGFLELDAEAAPEPSPAD